MRYHVTAWGSDEHPDLDYETDDPPPSDLTWKYPYVNVALLTPISYEALMAGLS